MELILLGIIALLVAVNLFLLLKQKAQVRANTLNALIKFEQQLVQIEKQAKDDTNVIEKKVRAFKLQREELTSPSRSLKSVLKTTLDG